MTSCRSGRMASDGGRFGEGEQRHLGDRVGRARVGARAARDARRVAEAGVDPGDDVRVRSRGPSRSARTCPGSRRRRARSARTRCRARGGRRGRGGAVVALACARAPGQRGSPTPKLRARPPRARCARRARSGELGEHELDDARRRRGARRGPACRRPCPRGTGVVHAAIGPGAPSTPTRHTRQAPNGARRSSKHSVGTSRPRGARGLERPSSRRRPRPRGRRSSGASSRAPALGGSGRAGGGSAPACRRRGRTGCRARASRAAPPGARGRRRARRANISCARCRPIRHGKHLPQLSCVAELEQVAATSRMSRCRRTRRCCRGRPCSPPRRAASKSNGVSSSDAGRMPPSGPPICTALIARPSTRPPATSSQQLAHRDAERHLDDAGPREALVEADELGAAALAGAERAVGVGAVAGDEPHVAQRLDVVDDRRHAEEPSARPGTAGAPRPCRAAPRGTRAARSPRRTTYEPAPSTIVDVEARTRCRGSSSPSRPAGARGATARLERRRWTRVLRAHVDEARARADRVARERHALEHQRRGRAPSGACRCTSRGRPRRRWRRRSARRLATVARELATCARPGSRRRRGRAARGLDLGEQLAGERMVSARRRPDQSPGSSAPARRAGCAPAARAPRGVSPASTRSTAPGPASIVSPSRTAGELWQKPRQTVSASESAPSALRSPSSTPRPAAQLVDVRAAGRREARGAGADAHVAAPARRAQVVVERRDAVDGRLGQPGLRGDLADVLVGQLAVSAATAASSSTAVGAARHRGGGRAPRDWRTSSAP